MINIRKLEAELWESADLFRAGSKLTSNQYQQIIIEYNNEQNRATIEKTFMELMNLANSLDKEEQRYVREGFDSDEELSLYDMLFRDDLSKADIKKIKRKKN